MKKGTRILTRITFGLTSSWLIGTIAFASNGAYITPGTGTFQLNETVELVASAGNDGQDSGYAGQSCCGDSGDAVYEFYDHVYHWGNENVVDASGDSAKLDTSTSGAKSVGCTVETVYRCSGSSEMKSITESTSVTLTVTSDVSQPTPVLQFSEPGKRNDGNTYHYLQNPSNFNVSVAPLDPAKPNPSDGWALDKTEYDWVVDGHPFSVENKEQSKSSSTITLTRNVETNKGGALVRLAKIEWKWIKQGQTTTTVSKHVETKFKVQAPKSVRCVDSSKAKVPYFHDVRLIVRDKNDDPVLTGAGTLKVEEEVNRPIVGFATTTLRNKNDKAILGYESDHKLIDTLRQPAGTIVDLPKPDGGFDDSGYFYDQIGIGSEAGDPSLLGFDLTQMYGQWFRKIFPDWAVKSDLWDAIAKEKNIDVNNIYAETDMVMCKFEFEGGAANSHTYRFISAENPSMKWGYFQPPFHAEPLTIAKFNTATKEWELYYNEAPLQP